MVVPFIPFRIPKTLNFFQLLGVLNNVSETGVSAIGKFDPTMLQSASSEWTNDFAISVSKGTPTVLGLMMGFIWIVGMMTTLFLFLRSKERLRQLKKSSLPLQNENEIHPSSRIAALLS